MGGIFGGGSSGSSSTVVNVPGPTPEETELTKQQIELQKEQIAILKSQREEQGVAFSFLQKSLDELNTRQQELEEDPVLKEVTDLQLDILRRGGRPSAEERQTILDATNAAIGAGKSDIQSFSSEAIQQIRDIMAPSRGLRPGDTPVIEASERVQQEATRQFGQLERGLQGVRAQAELDYPLARGQFLTEVSGFASNLAQSSREFQQNLRDRAFQNQLALSGMRTQSAMGLLGVSPTSTGALQALSAVRAAQTTTTSSFSQKQSGNLLGSLGNFAMGLGFMGSGIGSLFGGAGGAASMAGRAASAGGFLYPSSRLIKTEGRPIDGETALAMIEALPVEMWEYLTPYTGLSGTHLNTYAEDFQRITGLGDGKTIQALDLMGIIMAAQKEIMARMGKDS